MRLARPPNPSIPVAGLDGCPAGWVVAALDPSGSIALFVAGRFTDAVEHLPPETIMAVDMPIGLFEDGRVRFRACDVAARERLGAKRSSVFAPPTRAMLRAPAYDAARGDGLSIQAWGLAQKIAELDEVLTGPLRARVFESHPEVAFAAMNGGAPVLAKKRTLDGKRERRALLESTSAFRRLASTVDDFLAGTRRKDVREDDALDALALAWVARRRARGESVTLPAEPPRDARGLRMEIVY